MISNPAKVGFMAKIVNYLKKKKIPFVKMQEATQNSNFVSF